ncbi:MAG: phosphatase PAP2 family protein, partial [Bacteroidota bacterium]
MRKIFLLFSLLMVSQFQTYAQLRPYDIDRGSMYGVLGLGGALTFSSIMIGNDVEPLTIAEINALDPDRIWGIDRYSLRHFSVRADEATDKLLLAAFASPFLLLLDDPGRNNFGDISLIVFQGALLNSGLINLSKVLARRPRPYNYNPDAPEDFKTINSARYSFFSGHAATSAYFSFTTAKLFNDLYPDSRARPWVWAGAALVPLAVSYGRMRAGRHFFTDVLTGFAVGTAV